MRIWRNSGARDGDALVLTKALGTGVIANALQAGSAPDEAIAAAVASMTTLNRDAANALRARDPHAVTDVTGFGLVGHARELAAASGLEVELDSAALPLLPYALELVRQGRVPGGSRRNREAADAYASFDAAVEPALALLACDAQTSGGLLAALPADRAEGVGNDRRSRALRHRRARHGSLEALRHDGRLVGVDAAVELERDLVPAGATVDRRREEPRGYEQQASGDDPHGDAHGALLLVRMSRRAEMLALLPLYVADRPIGSVRVCLRIARSAENVSRRDARPRSGRASRVA